MSEIEEFGRRIGREFDAERIILFGSYARWRSVVNHIVYFADKCGRVPYER